MIEVERIITPEHIHASRADVLDPRMRILRLSMPHNASLKFPLQMLAQGA